MTKLGYAVEYMEYERGWGSRLDHTAYFRTYEKAQAAVQAFNSTNTETTVPDWYMTASFAGCTEIPEGEDCVG